MNTSSANKKGNSRKFNLIFFIDSEKTYHFKFNYILLKIFLSLFLVIIILAIFSIFISINIYKKNISFEKYITSVKKEVIEFYIEKEKNNENKENMVFNNNIKDDSEKLKITDIDQSDPNKTMVTENVETSKASSNKKGNLEVEKNNISNEINVLKDTMVKLENSKILQEQNQTKIYFNLSNINQNKSPLSGSVCAVIIGTNLKKETIIFKIPEKLILNSNNIPINCNDGEKVKFSRLRPTEFHVNAGKLDFLIKQVNIYFYHKNLNGIILNTINN
ncbi:hypothetical protein QEJ31_09205 [Pigmentibacter sp. JX0631]|uniref:hypothetical protein n=1 Tax=Pigmentibacter sp. JX0631 TaxID=2976982 RepID=UPI0024692E18|nr:hypothetical protein [Pigmentibacter sp. JX0631]WGL58706.1 hypothetical protein QEJ31_09205 [Pigmentibacter sp. JX0631]